MLIKGRAFLSGLPRTAEIKTNEIVKAISRELRDMIKAIKDVLQETPPELAADIIDKGIIMTGGSSMLRNLPELVYRRTGVKAILAEDALFCVVKGTGWRWIILIRIRKVSSASATKQPLCRRSVCSRVVCPYTTWSHTRRLRASKAVLLILLWWL